MSAASIFSPVRKHKWLTIALLAGFATAFLFQSKLPENFLLVVAWDAFTSVFLLIAWIGISRSRDEDVRKQAERYDFSDSAVLLLCLCAVMASLGGILWLVESSAQLNPGLKEYSLGLAVLTVAFSWLFLHTVLGIHYAHAYYWPKQDAAGAHMGGLEFPGGEAPDYLDFLYFSFVLGAAAQTSDVAITAKPIRRLVMLHTMLSFVFNTVLLALTVNIASTLL